MVFWCKKSLKCRISHFFLLLLVKLAYNMLNVDLTVEVSRSCLGDMSYIHGVSACYCVPSAGLLGNNPIIENTRVILALSNIIP